MERRVVVEGRGRPSRGDEGGPRGPSGAPRVPEGLRAESYPTLTKPPPRAPRRRRACFGPRQGPSRGDRGPGPAPAGAEEAAPSYKSE